MRYHQNRRHICLHLDRNQGIVLCLPHRFWGIEIILKIKQQWSLRNRQEKPLARIGRSNTTRYNMEMPCTHHTHIIQQIVFENACHFGCGGPFKFHEKYKHQNCIEESVRIDLFCYNSISGLCRSDWMYFIEWNPSCWSASNRHQAMREKVCNRRNKVMMNSWQTNKTQNNTAKSDRSKAITFPYLNIVSREQIGWEEQKQKNYLICLLPDRLSRQQTKKQNILSARVSMEETYSRPKYVSPAFCFCSTKTNNNE